jgi:hypothetical protein
MYERPARGHNPTALLFLLLESFARLHGVDCKAKTSKATHRSFTCTLAGIHMEDTQLVVQMIHQVGHKPQEIHTFFVYRDGITTAACANCLHFDTD